MEEVKIPATEPSDTISGSRSDQTFDATLKGRILENHRRGDNPAGDTFYQFRKLPIELRHMIWEYTWPAPRMIEVAVFEDETTLEYKEVAILRFAGPLSVLLEKDFGSRVVEESPVQKCRPPVALQVCHESREHTLSQYRIMVHTISRAGSFYFNPYCDVLWFSLDFTDEPSYLQDLERCYSEQLNAIETILVEEIEWIENTPAWYTSYYLRPLGGLKTILLLFRDDDDDDDEEEEEEEEEEDSDEGSEIEDEELYERADELRAEYAKLFEHQEGTAKTMWCIDRSGTFY